MGWRTVWLILKLMLLALSTAAASDSPQCQVWASDDGKWSVGGRGQVTCACDGSDGDDPSLHLSGNILATEKVNNTVWYTEPSATETVQNTYECWWKEFPAKSVMVTVFAVLNVTDLSCRFDIREELNCSFSRADGEEFHETTRYQLAVASGTTSQCTAVEGKAARMHCMLDMGWLGYAYEMPSLNFTLTMMSDRGGGTQTQEIQLSFDSMYVPKWPSTKPVRTTVANNQTCLAWDYAKDLVERELEWVVELRPRRPEIPPLNLTLPGGEATDQMKLTFCFPHPPQGFQVFDVGLKCHIKGNNTIWSEYYPEFDITTNATLPARPPQFMPNGFSYDKDSNELTVLWFPLDEIDHNGPNLTYDVYFNGNQKASHTYGRSATFTNWDASQPANVTVRSRNSEGASVDSRCLWVPAISDVANRQATHLTYHYHENGSTTFTWDKPEDNDLLLGYTIYWCNASNTIGRFCLDGVRTNNISLDDAERQEYEFDSSEAQRDIALEPNYSDHVSGGMSVLLAVKNEKPFTWQKARILEGLGALLVLGLVVMSARRLRNMNAIEVDLSFMPDVYAEQNRSSVEPKAESKYSPRLGVPGHMRNRNYDPETIISIELQTFTEQQPEGDQEEGQAEESFMEVVAQTETEPSSYVCMNMNRGNAIGRNDAIRPPSPRINHSNGYVIGPSPRLNPPPPRLNPNNEGYINPPSPRLIPNNEGYSDPDSPLLNRNNNPNSIGYVMAPNNIDPPPPRLIPNTNGYINPPPPRG